MFCPNCGCRLQEGQRFCGKCGAPVELINESDTAIDLVDADMISSPEQQVEIPDENVTQNIPKAVDEEFTTKSENSAKQNDISQMDENSLINKIVLKLDSVLAIIESIIYFVFGYLCFSEGGFWKAFGVLLMAGSIVAMGAGVKRLISHSWRKNISEKDLGRKKAKLFVSILLIIVIFAIIKNTGGGTYLLVKEISFDEFGTETIGEIIEDNIKSPKWSQKKLDSNTKRIFVEGYSPLYNEEIRIIFYFENKDEGYEITLQSIALLESEEVYSDGLNTSIIWASFYN